MRTRSFNLLVALVVAAACKPSWHLGETTTLNNVGVERHTIIYWSSTKRPLFYDGVSDTAYLKMECSLKTLAFKELDGRVVYRGSPATDVRDGEPVEEGAICGFLEYEREGAWLEPDDLETLRTKKVRVTLSCEPLIGPGSFGAFYPSVSAPVVFQDIEGLDAKAHKQAPLPKACADDDGELGDDEFDDELNDEELE